jgi:23S rRNA (uracil1939-C5)-methyltransferase
LEDCGACTLLTIDEKTQLAEKTRLVRTAFEASADVLGKVKVAPCTAAPQRLSYRHTAKLVVSEKKKPTGEMFVSLGLYRPGTHDVVDIGNCPVQAPHLNAICSFLRRKLKDHQIPIYNERTHRGDLRYIALRTSHTNRETLVTFVSAKGEKGVYMNLARELMEKFSTTLKGVLLLKNAEKGNAIFPAETFRAETETEGTHKNILTGTTYLHEGAAGLNLRVSAESFFQVNPAVAEAMYTRVVELSDVTAHENVLDLYCGIGPLALLFAQRCRRVLGIEENPIAIEDAKANAELNRIPNLDFVAGRAEDVFESALAAAGNSQYGVVCVNPSRRGCQNTVLEKISQLEPRRIVYMSCNVDTLVRDARNLVKQGYRILTVEPYDMFPGTPHIETICLFEKL